MKAALKHNGERQRVRATYNMDTSTFAKHFTMRHADSLAGLTTLPEDMAYDVEMAYRSFHRRLHETRPLSDYDHDHTEDPPEAAIEWSLFCLRGNRARGWHEIASLEGVVVGYFPDKDTWATRVNGEIDYQDTIEEVVAYLMDITIPE